jgi:hypothetical protein
MQRWNVVQGLSVGAGFLALSLSGCSIKPVSNGNSNSSTCTYTLSGAASTGSTSYACSALSVEDTGFWQVSITQDTGNSSSYVSLSCTLSIDGSAPTAGTYTQSNMSASICTVNPPGSGGDFSNAWMEKGATSDDAGGGAAQIGSVSLTISSASQFAPNDYNIHGSAAFTLQGQGSATGTTTGTVSF